jgi:hypothetical protein
MKAKTKIGTREKTISVGSVDGSGLGKERADEKKENTRRIPAKIRK